ncbi:hypothetical protein GCM10010156_13620 [Planobispora rosea]|uniref:STAS domain-containing protein n=1 Tax=Planobispora rosea TaxID=35762 RepID=A0A8J3WD54_PLARO|nr:STAS domain-containing protein [Planobispora rosea]GGS56322.1 hypothetical protein GCM10010156_13620 [Planobispora rosea]GIH83566.1 hypothetical protein Pro02_19740 [Planobispora rosea]
MTPVDGETGIPAGRLPGSGGTRPAELVLYQDHQLRVVRCDQSAGRMLQVSGQIDAANSAALARILAGADGDGAVVDIGRVTFVDVSGLRALVTSRESSPCWTHLRNTPPYVQRLLTVLGWSRTPEETFAGPL